MYIKAINATTASSASFIKDISSIIASSTNTIATESKSTSRTLNAVITTSAFIFRVTLKLVIAVVATSAVTVKNTLKVINSLTNTATTINRAVSKPIVAVVTFITNMLLTKVQFKTLEVILTTGAFVGLITSHFKTLVAALHTNSYLYKAVIKTINGVTNIASIFSMGVRKTLTAVVTTGAFVGLITSHFKTLAASVVMNSFILKLASKTITALSTLTASTTKRIATTKKASVGTVSRNLVLAFFIGIRKLSLYYTRVIGGSPIYVSPETTTIVVPQEYRTITVPPEDTENA